MLWVGCEGVELGVGGGTTCVGQHCKYLYRITIFCSSDMDYGCRYFLFNCDPIFESVKNRLLFNGKEYMS